MSEQHRARMVSAASRLLRERGAEGVTVSSVTGAVGLTQGAFYKQFDSKQALLVEACAAAAETRRHDHDEEVAHQPGVPGWSQLVEQYLSTAHRDAPGEGCPVTALSSVAARTEDPAFRDAYRAAADDLVGMVEQAQGGGREEALRAAAQLVGALTLARALVGDPLSEDILDTVRRALT